MGNQMKLSLGFPNEVEVVRRYQLEEGAQFAIGKGVQNYYNKKNNNEPTSFLESLSEGFVQTFGTDEGMENVLIGGLSGAGARA